jgi:hypothetical protein
MGNDMYNVCNIFLKEKHGLQLVMTIMFLYINAIFTFCKFLL